jgi:hypothetical protein
MNSFIGFTVNLQWHLHHIISLARPKFGELIAFKNVIDSLPPTFTDEEQIASIIKSNGYTLRYVPDALIYNKGPENIIDFLRQRRRIYAGHLMLKNKYGYEAATLNGRSILKYLRRNLSPEYMRHKFWLIGAILLEGVGRMLARLDILFGKDHYRWEISGTTKDLSIDETAIR